MRTGPPALVMCGVASAVLLVVAWQRYLAHPRRRRPAALRPSTVRYGETRTGSPTPRPRSDSSDPAGFGPSLVMVGSAFNSTAVELARYTTRTAYIIPVSDNGGSSREIIRVLGGPAIGDIRSRLIRLAAPCNPGDEAVIQLLRYRLPWDSRENAKLEFLRIVDGTHEKWDGIPEAYKQTVRAFLLHFFANAMRRESVQELSYDVINVANELAAHFDYRGGSIGNFMLTGARLFFSSLEAAIFWFSNLAGIPRTSYVVPVINVNSKVTLAVRLQNGVEIVGQGNISGPAPMVHGAKADMPPPLPDAIREVYYISEHGSEVLPPVNPATLTHLQCCEAVVYTMGSLYTSILPSLVLQGVGPAIAAKRCPKVLILNGVPDRETSWTSRRGSSKHMMAVDVVDAVTAALNQNEGAPEPHPCQSFITHVLYLQASAIVPFEQLQKLADLGLVAVEIPREFQDGFYYNNRMLVKALRSILESWEVRQMCDQRREAGCQSPAAVFTASPDETPAPLLTPPSLAPAPAPVDHLAFECAPPPL